MTPGELARIFEAVMADIGDARLTMGNVAFTVGFLLGGDAPYGAMLMLLLAESKYGEDDPDLTELRRRIGVVRQLRDAP